MAFEAMFDVELLVIVDVDEFPLPAVVVVVVVVVVVLAFVFIVTFVRFELLALLLALSPQAIPSAPSARTLVRAITFFITNYFSCLPKV